MPRLLLLAFLAIAAVLALLVTVMNSDDVEVELAFIRFTSPLGLLLVLVFAAGLIAGLFWQMYWIAALLSERGRLRRALRLAESRARPPASVDAG